MGCKQTGRGNAIEGKNPQNVPMVEKRNISLNTLNVLLNIFLSWVCRDEDDETGYW
jgi:hypothetical protein